MTSLSPPPSTQQVVLAVSGMKCAGCVRAVEKRLQQQPGVATAVVNLVTEQAAIEYVPQEVEPASLAQVLTTAGFPSHIQNREEDAEPLPLQPLKEIQPLVLATVLVVLSGVGHLGHIPGFTVPWLTSIQFHWGLATLALLGPGRPILQEGWQGLWQNRPNMNTLISLGSVTAYLASVVAVVWPQLYWDCFFDAPVMIVGLILLGRALEAQARGRTKASLEKLLALQPMVARWLPNPETQPDQAVDIPVRDVQIGAWLQVLPGDKFPVDGRVLEGSTLVDEAMLTGEAMPVPKASGDEVVAGTLNQSALITIEATRTGQQTTLAQIIDLVETAQTRKAPIQQFADRVAGYFTYGVLAIATLTFLFWVGIGVHLWPDVLASGTLPMVHSPDVGMAEMIPRSAGILLGLKLAIAVLVIACPCALGLATPTAILVGTSLGAERGLLIRGGDVLEQVDRLDTLIFDKTGTLTTGHPQVTDYWVSEGLPALPVGDHISSQTVLQLAASLEKGSRHPLATAIVEQADAQELAYASATALETVPGCGIEGQLDEAFIRLGSAQWLRDCGIVIPPQDQHQGHQLAQAGKTLIHLANDQTYVGGLAVQDTLRSDAAQTLKDLKGLGLRIQMLTGDQAETAHIVAQELGLEPTAVQAGVAPGDKAAVIADLQAQGHQVGMVGDGINDAPALAQADVGISLSGGTDVAIETAQIILMSGEANPLYRLVDVLRLSRATFRKIQQNLFWALIYNLIGLPIAAGILLPKFGILLSPASSAALMAFSSVSVVANSLQLRRLSL